jgi:hypothetical protein
MDTYNTVDVKSKDDIFEIGKEFAFEGLTEEYFKANNPSELERFRLGYQAGLAMQPEASFPTEEFKNMCKR